MKPNKNITLKQLLIKERKQIGLQFYPDKTIQAIIKTIPGIKWSNDYSMCYLLYTKDNLKRVFETFRGVAWINGDLFFSNKKTMGNKPLCINDYRKRNLKPGYRACPEAYLQKLEIKRYSYNTAKSYIHCFESFLQKHKHLELKDINENEIRLYLQSLVQEGKSDSYINQSINSIKFYYELVLSMPNRFYSIERPRRDEKLPTVLSKAEIAAMIESTKNLKHKCIIELLYSAGLRRSELLNLKLTEIDSARMVIKISEGKGDKDRYTLLGQRTLENLRLYYKAYRPITYLVEGDKGKKYSETSVANIVREAAKKAGIKKRVTPHTLRHSFATHLLEDGVNLRNIQVLLGHSSSKTTEIYTHVANNMISKIINPLDSLFLNK